MARDYSVLYLGRETLLFEGLGKVGRNDCLNEWAKLLAEVVAGFFGHLSR